jgi:hypothetical protein
MGDMNLLNVRGHNLCASGFMLGIVCRSIQTLCAFRECLPSVVDKLTSVYAAAVLESNRHCLHTDALARVRSFSVLAFVTCIYTNDT